MVPMGASCQPMQQAVDGTHAALFKPSPPGAPPSSICTEQLLRSVSALNLKHGCITFNCREATAVMRTQQPVLCSTTCSPVERRTSSMQGEAGSQRVAECQAKDARLPPTPPVLHDASSEILRSAATIVLIANQADAQLSQRDF